MPKLKYMYIPDGILKWLKKIIVDKTEEEKFITCLGTDVRKKVLKSKKDDQFTRMNSVLMQGVRNSY